MISRNRLIQSIYDSTWGRFIFAGAYDSFLRRAEREGLSEQRRRVVSKAAGRTLEIATGTGLNLPHYPPAVRELVLTEPYPHMLSILRRKVEGLGLRATVVEACAERLPFPDASFDTVVATMILCSAENPNLVLGEIARILRPGGQYLFLEHVRNPDPKVSRRQDRVQPAWYLFANGCHCNRDTIQTLEDSVLEIEELRHGKIPMAWSIVEAMVTGCARKPSTAPNAIPRLSDVATSNSCSECN
jgi:ubiquinone/menaquinone biosynthesis C-methylase UbiE